MIISEILKPVKVRLLLLLVLPLLMNAQDYTPMLSDHNEWQVTNCFFGCLTDAYYTDGDTIANGYSHKILDGYHYISRTFLLREDISEKKVYLTRAIDETTFDEFLLYDFSLAVGDSIEMMNPITPFPENGGYFTVDSIVPRSLQDGLEYDHFYFSPSTSNQISNHFAEWIEGIGSMSIINAPGGDPDINGAGHLSCYFSDGVHVYQNLDSIASCKPFLSVNDILRSAPQFKAIYKTTTHSIEVQLNGNFQEIRLFDLSGKQLFRLPVENEEVIETPLPKLSTGVYLLVATNRKGQSSSQKLLVK